MPAASVAIILSGTGSAREYIQRLGRVLRKGKTQDKRAIWYEIVAHNTSKEGLRQGEEGTNRQGAKKRRKRVINRRRTQTNADSI